MQRSDRLAGLGGYRAERKLHAPVLERRIGVRREVGLALVVLEVHLELDIAALGVDLLSRKLRTVLDRVAVNGIVAGQRRRAADLERSAGSSVFFRAAVVGGGSIGTAAAARQRADQHRAGQKHAQTFLHGYLLLYSVFPRFPNCVIVKRPDDFLLYYSFAISADFFSCFAQFQTIYRLSFSHKCKFCAFFRKTLVRPARNAAIGFSCAAPPSAPRALRRRRG